jgi:hypothetical protein
LIIDETALLHDDLFKNGRQAQFFDGRNVDLDMADHHGDRAALPEHIHPKAADARFHQGEVDLEFRFEHRDLFGRHAVVRHLAHGVRIEHLSVDRHHLAGDLDLNG